MRQSRVAASGWLHLTVATILAIGTSCQDTRDSASGTDGTLRPVPLPSLAELPKPVQEQLRRQHSELEVRVERDSAFERLADAYGRMGELLLAYGLDRAAEPALLNAADLQPDDLRWHYYLAYLYQESGAMERAAERLQRVLAVQPDYLPARNQLALVQAELGRDSEAEALLTETLRLDPENAVAHLLLGHLVASEDPSRAIEHYETVLKLQPDASQVHYPLAQAYRRLNDLDRSLELLEKVGTGSVQRRDSLLRRLTEIRRGAGAHISRGVELAVRGHYSEAVAAFEEAARADSTSVASHLNLGMAAARLGQFERATRALEEVIRLDPSNSQAHYGLGLILVLSSGSEDEALEHFQAAVEADPGYSAAHVALANLQWRRGRCREALNGFEEYLSVNPQHLQTRIRKAVCHAHLGEHAAARDVLEAGHEGDPDEPRLKNALVRVLAASPDSSVRDGPRAVLLAEQLVEDHRRPDTLESLAMAYAEVGRFEDAVRHQEEAIRDGEREGLSVSRLRHMRANLQRFTRGEPSRSPWRPNVFDG